MARQCILAASCQHDKASVTLQLCSRLTPPRIRPSSPHTVARAQSVQDRETNTREQDIENLDKNYCNDFVCESSPAVEQAVRALAKDIEVPKRWTRQLFTKDVSYSGGFRSFRGFDRYQRHLFITENVDSPEVTVERLRLVKLGTAIIDWRLQGRLLRFVPIDVNVESTFELNMLTGRVEAHKDDWQLGKCSPLGAAVFTMVRAGWALKQQTIDLREDTDRLFERLQNKQGPIITGDPSDPNKFFIEDDTQFKDAVLFCAVLALFWLFFKAQYLVHDL